LPKSLLDGLAERKAPGPTLQQRESWSKGQPRPPASAASPHSASQFEPARSSEVSGSHAARAPAAAAAQKAEENSSPQPQQNEAPLEAVAPAELVIRFNEVRSRRGAPERKLVIKIQDTGGQPVFVQLIERLMSPQGTAYMLVFSLPKLRDSFASAMAGLVYHLQSIASFAIGAPLILVGTRKDQVMEAELRGLSDRMLAELHRRCPHAISGLVTQGPAGKGLCFFPVENSRGYQGDGSIRELVAAVEEAADRLPTTKQRVPLAWLQVYGKLQQASRSVGRSSSRMSERWPAGAA
jgi:hypothetical protein